MQIKKRVKRNLNWEGNVEIIIIIDKKISRCRTIGSWVVREAALISIHQSGSDCFS
jgi:hypothetical protein